MIAGLAFLALGFLFGLAGALLIALFLRGLAAIGAIALWLLAPIALFALVLAGSIDPSWIEQQSNYNFAMAFVIGGAAIAVVWAPGVLIGAVIGRLMRKHAPVPAVVAPAVPPGELRRAMPAGAQKNRDGLPDWGTADEPLLSLDQLGALMREIAGKAGIPERILPTIGPSNAGEGSYIDRDKAGYAYAGLERGAKSFEHRTKVADRLMYHVFRDKAWMTAAGYVVGGPYPIEQDPTKIAERQQAILAAVDPRWGWQFAIDQGQR